jgi:superoxide dismutase, Cu-Zn family
MPVLRFRAFCCAVLLLALATGCPEPDAAPVRTAVHVAPDPGVRAPEMRDRSDRTMQARARIIDREGKTVGRASFYTVPVGVALRVEAKGLPPGRRGVHIHEHGICDPKDEFESAGSHWSPKDREHGLENPEGHHAGDMPNLEVKADGTVDFHYILPRATLRSEGAFSLVSGNATSIVIHAEKDDQRTDPAGGAGPRIACGVIERVKGPQ